jgi:hypothetical protein
VVGQLGSLVLLHHYDIMRPGDKGGTVDMGIMDFGGQESTPCREPCQDQTHGVDSILPLSREATIPFFSQYSYLQECSPKSSFLRMAQTAGTGEGKRLAARRELTKVPETRGMQKKTKIPARASASVLDQRWFLPQASNCRNTKRKKMRVLRGFFWISE